jgi:hypothetical protein
MKCAQLQHVDDHFRARLTPAAEQALRLHLPTCASCHARYERQLLLERLSGRRITAKARLARALGLRTPRRLPIALPIAGFTFAGAAALALIVLLRPPAHPAFEARGALHARAAVPTSQELQLFRVDSRGRPAPVAGSVAVRDELGVSYRNPTGKRRLMVFARDVHNHFYWYHPAWLREAEDPVAIPIASDSELHDLGEVVAHDFDADRIVLYALFTDEPLSVRELEAMARQQPLERLSVPGAQLLAMPLRVER